MTAASERPGRFDRKTWLEIAIQAALFAAVYNVGIGLVDRQGVLVTFVVSIVSAFLVFSGFDLVKKLLKGWSKRR